MNEETAKSREEIVAARRARRASASEDVMDGKAMAIPQSKMVNEAEEHTLPGGLSLELRALSIRRMRELTGKIQQAWPDAAQAIALTKPLPGGGYDIDAIAVIIGRMSATEADSGDVASAIAGLSFAFGSENGDCLPRIAECLLMLSPADSPPEKTAIVAVLEDCSIPQLIDLLRTIWAAVGGFEGDLKSRFEIG